MIATKEGNQRDVSYYFNYYVNEIVTVLYIHEVIAISEKYFNQIFQYKNGNLFELKYSFQN